MTRVHVKRARFRAAATKVAITYHLPTGDQGPYPVDDYGVTSAFLGAYVTPTGALVDYDLDDWLVSETALGASDVYGCDFSAGSCGASYAHFGGETLAVSGGVLQARGSGAGSAFLELRLVDYVYPYPAPAIYSEFKVLFHADAIAAGHSTPFLARVNGTNAVAGVKFDFSGGGWGVLGTDGEYLVIPDSVVAGVWYTLGVSFVKVPV